MWSKLRNRQLGGFRFNRQVQIDGRIVDFLCRDARLIVEVDGGQHDARHELDNLRTAELEAAGYKVVRFWNNDVLTNTEGVAFEVLKALQSLENRG